MDNKKESFINYIKEGIMSGRNDGFDKISIEEENESDGLSLSIYFIKDNSGIGKRIEEYREQFYKINRNDLNKIKDKLKLKKVKVRNRQDFGEWVRTIDIEL